MLLEYAHRFIADIKRSIKEITDYFTIVLFTKIHHNYYYYRKPKFCEQRYSKKGLLLFETINMKIWR